MNGFTYNGINSIDMGLKIISKNVFSSPAYDMTFQAIPGRNGDLILPNGRYPNIQITYSVFLPAKSKVELSTKINNIKGWLYGGMVEYHILTDTYDTQYFRYGVFNSGLDIEDELNKIGVFTVSFSCKPFKYTNAGQQTLNIAFSNTSVTNPTAFDSLPYMKIYGSGTGNLTLTNSSGSSSWYFLSISSYIEADSELMNFYKGSSPLNSSVSGTGFPMLTPGVNTFTFSGNITKIELIPRWRSL